LFGAMFAVANTMYGAVMSRSREIGTLRSLGFNRLNVVTSFMVESLVLCLAGGVLGCLGTLPLNGLSTGTANWDTFSEITFGFRFSWLELLRGTALAVTMGVLGGSLPALRAVRMKIVNALREA
jgi:putative ABC transport system permease protein